MWVVGYDPADTNDLQAGGLEHWLRRHGSPFNPDSKDFIAAYWIPITSIPSLRDLATASDFILISVPKLQPPKRHILWTNMEPPPHHIREVLSEIGSENALLSIEFTYNMDFGSQAIARFNNITQPALLGVPTFFALPDSAVALRGNKRTGNKNAMQKKWDLITSKACESLVKSNSPVNYATVSAILGRTDLPSHTTNKGSWKVDLMLAVIGDTWNVAASVINLPESVVYFPDKWKMSGCQLLPVYDLIRFSIDIWNSEGRRFKPSDSAVKNLRKASENKIAKLGPPLSRARKMRNPEWDDICTKKGYPPQSRCSFRKTAITGLEEMVRQNHHSLMSPELTVVKEFNTSSVKKWQFWTDVQSIERAGQGQVLKNGDKLKRLKTLRTRNYGKFKLSILPDELKERNIVATMHIKDHTARGSAPLHQNISGERTYLGRAEMMDLVNFRKYVGNKLQPRAGANDRKKRFVIFALDLPITSTKITELSESNTAAELWYKLGDIFVLEDGIFLGREWTGGGLLRLA